MSMTESEALAELKTFPVNCLDFIENQALGVAISALEEIQQYRAIGTVEQFRELEEKKISDREENALAMLHKFIEEHDVECVEEVFQRDSVNEDCVDLVANMVGAILLGWKVR